MRVRMKLLSGIMATVMVGMLATKAEAINDYIPDLYIYEQNGHPCVNINIDMATDDIIYTYNFNDESNLNLTMPGTEKGAGNQAVCWEGINGSKCLSLNDNITSRSGNRYWYPETSADTSVFQLLKKFTEYSNGTWFSMSAKVRAYGTESWLELATNSPWGCKGEPCYDNSGDLVKVARTVDLKRDFNRIYITTDKGYVNWPDNASIGVILSKDVNYNYAYTSYRFNKSESCLIFDPNDWPTPGNCTGGTPNRDTFYAGDTLLHLHQESGRGAWKKIQNDNQWRTITVNFKMPDTGYFDWHRGLLLEPGWKTNGKIWLDDMRFGKASKVQVAREDGTIVYDDYGSEFTDTGISSTPMKPEVTNATTLENSVHFNFNAKNSSKTVNYKARSLGSSGNSQSQWSRLFPVTLASEIKGYSVVVDTNPRTEPATVVNNTSGEISIDDRYKRDDVIYCHVKAVNQNGNWSETMHYKYTVKQTLKDYKADIKQLEDDSDKVARSYSYEERLGIKDKINKTANDLRTNPNLNDYKPEVVINNKDSSNAETEFSSGEKLVNIYVKKS